jgi:DNA polymerase-4
MHYILAIGLERFYSARQQEPVCAFVWEGRVVDASPGAEARGVARGMAEGEARSLLRSDGPVRQVDWEEWREAAQPWLDLCAEASAVVEPVRPDLAFVDLGAHPAPSEVAAELLARLARAPGHGLRAGAAPMRWAAELAMTPCDPAALALGLLPIEPVRDAAAFLAPLPVRLLAPALPKHRERLEFLGYRTIGAVAQAPYPQLVRQFGGQAMTLHLASRGRLADPAQAIHPGESLAWERSFGAGLDDALALDAAYAEAARALGAELTARSLAARESSLTLFDEEGRWASAARPFARAAQDPGRILQGLRQMGGGLRLAEPPARVWVRMRGLGPAAARQGSLLAESPARAAQLDEALAELQGAFGRQSLVRGGEVHVERRVRLMRVWGHATGWR